MTIFWLLIVLHVAIVACGLVAGVFLTFSDFVMKSLVATQGPGGIEAMQIINRKVMPTVFMVLLLGMSALAPVLGLYAYMAVPASASGWIIAGCFAYIIGVFMVTAVFNVPMNQQLEGLDNTTAAAAEYWQHYVPRWSMWNPVRTAAAAAAAVCLLVGSSRLAGAI
ncbi:MAG: DUF1772 domain-containing protein [Alphaproteobacteria bacterium]|nr:DUF1772 domain-containing protein [Alphaproteobacteria bacterium]